MTNDMERRVVEFLKNGGMIFSGPKDGAWPFWRNGKYLPVIRQDFLTLTGERIEGFGNAAFQWARKNDLLRAVRRYQITLQCPGSTIVATASYYVGKD